MLGSPLSGMLGSMIRGEAGEPSTAPSGYISLKALNDSSTYVVLLTQGDDGIYRPLYGKTA